MSRLDQSSGYVALMAVLIVGAAAIAISTGLLLTSADSQKSAQIARSSTVARANAASCADYALEYLHENTAFTGTGTLSLSEGDCSYAVTNTGGGNRSIVTTGTQGNSTQRLQIAAVAGSNSNSISSWQEIADSTSMTITHVQSNGSTNNSGSSSIAQAFGSSVTAGNTIVAAISWDTSSSSTVTCSDTRGNSYTTIGVWNDTSNAQALAICYATNITGGSDTVTATFGASGAFRRIIVSEYSGIAKAVPVETSIGVAGSTATTAADAVSSGFVTTTQHNELIYGAVMDTASATSITAGSGFTQRFSVNGKDLAVQDKILANPGTVASTQTFGAAHRYDAVVVAFTAANP